MFANVVPTEALIVAGIIVLIFGARKLPDIGRGLGEGIKEFKTATKKAKEDAPPEIPPSTDSPAS